jgi:hypothetical protein
MLSLPKIALTVVIIIVAIFGYRLYSQLRGKGTAESAVKDNVLDLTQCPACKKYVDTDNIECLRGDCPYV